VLFGKGGGRFAALTNQQSIGSAGLLRPRRLAHANNAQSNFNANPEKSAAARRSGPPAQWQFLAEAGLRQGTGPSVRQARERGAVTGGSRRLRQVRPRR